MLFVIAGGAGGYFYVQKLQADLKISEANNAKLQESVADQKAVIEQQQKDFTAILATNKALEETNKQLRKEFADLDQRFNKINGKGEVRDVGKLAVEKDKLVERVINNASDKAMRCAEIAMGAPLTEKEKNATKKSEINSECPSIANPKYVPYD